MKPPRVSVGGPWIGRGARRTCDLSALAQLIRRRKQDAVARLNEATQSIFPNIADESNSGSAALRYRSIPADAATGAAVDKSKYLSGFSTANFFFFPGPAGYDASLTLQPQDSSGLDVSFGKRIDVQISGFVRDL